MTHPLRMLFENGTTKSFAISILMGVGGWAAHTLLDSNKQGAQQAVQLDEHSRQIHQLWETAKDTNFKVQGLEVTSARIEGKIDTLGTKIDDDRATRGRSKTSQ